MITTQGLEKKILRKRYNNCKNVLNKARKRLRRKHKREVVREIEKLSTRCPGEDRRLLKQLSGRKKKKTKPMKTMVDEEGYEVEGAEIQRVWKEAFEKLGKKGGQETFDVKFTESVEKEEEEIEQTNKERGSSMYKFTCVQNHPHLATKSCRFSQAAS